MRIMEGLLLYTSLVDIGCLRPPRLRVSVTWAEPRPVELFIMSGILTIPDGLSSQEITELIDSRGLLLEDISERSTWESKNYPVESTVERLAAAHEALRSQLGRLLPSHEFPESA
jgi:hypothetical protein